MSMHFANMPLAASAPGGALAPLEALPWFSPDGKAWSPSEKRRGAGAGHGAKGLRDIGLAAIVAALVGSTWVLAGGTAPQAEPAMQPLASPAIIAALPAVAAADAPSGDNMAATGPDVAIALEPAMGDDPRTGPQARSAALAMPARGKPVAGRRASARTPVESPLPAAKPSPATDQGLASNTTAMLAQPPMPSSESAVAAATLRQFRSIVSQARSAARDVIRLGGRGRPGRNASAEEQTGYRLRQQNAEAARSYLGYLDTLARSMKGTSSESVAQQSLAKARQTLGYLASMEADSQASLR